MRQVWSCRACPTTTALRMSTSIWSLHTAPARRRFVAVHTLQHTTSAVRLPLQHAARCMSYSDAARCIQASNVQRATSLCPCNVPHATCKITVQQLHSLCKVHVAASAARSGAPVRPPAVGTQFGSIRRTVLRSFYRFRSSAALHSSGSLGRTALTFGVCLFADGHGPRRAAVRASWAVCAADGSAACQWAVQRLRDGPRSRADADGSVRCPALPSALSRTVRSYSRRGSTTNKRTDAFSH